MLFTLKSMPFLASAPLKNSGEVSSPAAFRTYPLFQGKPKHRSQFKTLEGLVIALSVE